MATRTDDTAPIAAPAPPASTPALRTRGNGDDASIEGVIDLVRDYAKQETIGPLKGAGRWLGYGVLGALLLGSGLALVMLGLLRLIQTEWTRSATGSLSWVSYAIVLVVCVIVIAIAVSRINKSSLNKETE